MIGYDKIGAYGQIIFDKTHKRHLASVGEKYKRFYEKDQIESIKANNKEGCLEVYYKHGEIIKYTPNFTWH